MFTIYQLVIRISLAHPLHVSFGAWVKAYSDYPNFRESFTFRFEGCSHVFSCELHAGRVLINGHLITLDSDIIPVQFYAHSISTYLYFPALLQ